MFYISYTFVTYLLTLPRISTKTYSTYDILLPVEFSVGVALLRL
jgi:hypothetical protein